MTEQYQRENKDRDPSGIRVGAWDAGLFGCCSHLMPNCCMATCLPCISVAQISSRIGLHKFSHVFLTFLILYVAAISTTSISWYHALKGTDKGKKDFVNDNVNFTLTTGTAATTAEKHDQQSAKFFTLGSIVSDVLLLVYFLLIWRLRSNVRSRFQIPGNCCSDCCSAMCCSCCAIAQMATHVKSYKPGSCDFGPPDTLPGYN